MLTAMFDDSGQGLGEYAVLLAFIAVLCIAAIMFIGNHLFSQYQDISTSYP